jgi:hypothetical protein
LFLCLRLRRFKPDTSAVRVEFNSGFSSADWIASSVEPLASAPCSMLFIAVVEIPACDANCAWVNRAIARPARICSIVIMCRSTI